VRAIRVSSDTPFWTSLFTASGCIAACSEYSYIAITALIRPSNTHSNRQCQHLIESKSNRRYDLSQTPLAHALAHEARRTLGDRLRASPESAAALESALTAALTQTGLPGAREAAAAAAGGGGCAAVVDSYYSTLGLSVGDRLKMSSSAASGGAAAAALQLTWWSAGGFRDVVAGLVKTFEREVKELNLLLVPEVRG